MDASLLSHMGPLILSYSELVRLYCPMLESVQRLEDSLLTE